MSESKDTNQVRISQVLAGALAAVTAALIGSTMGVAGTVVGAGLASVISTVGGTLYLRSIQRTTDSVRTVRAKVVGRSGGATVLVADEDPSDESTPGEEVEASAAEPVSESESVAGSVSGSAEEAPADRPPAGRRRWLAVVVTSIAAFALGMAVITGVEWLRGESLSGGEGTTFGSVVVPHQDPSGTQDPTTPTTSTTTPTPTSTEPTTSTPPTTTSTPGTSGSSTTTTTTTPPMTTTTEAPPSAGTIPPSG